MTSNNNDNDHEDKNDIVASPWSLSSNALNILENHFSSKRRRIYHEIQSSNQGDNGMEMEIVVKAENNEMPLVAAETDDKKNETVPFAVPPPPPPPQVTPLVSETWTLANETFSNTASLLILSFHVKAENGLPRTWEDFSEVSFFPCLLSFRTNCCF